MSNQRTTGEIITAALKIYGSSGGTAYSNLETRYRSEWALGRVAEKAIACSNVWSRNVDGTSTVTAGTGFGAAPSNFSNMGTQGSITVTGQLVPMTYTQPDELFDLLRSSTAQSTVPTRYTLHTITGGVPNIYVHPVNSSTITLILKNYIRNIPEMVDCPTAPTVAAGASGSVTAGAHLYRVTYDWSSAAYFTEGGIASTSITASGSTKIELTGIPISQARIVETRRIWRTKAAGSIYYLLATISDNVTTTYSDNIADASITVALHAPSAATTGAEEFPPDFTHSVLYSGLVCELTGQFGDMRGRDFWDEWTRDVRRMWAQTQQGQNTLQAMPVYGAIRNRGGFNRSRLIGS